MEYNNSNLGLTTKNKFKHKSLVNRNLKKNQMKKTTITIKAFAVLVLAITIATSSSAQNQKDSVNKADMLKQRIELSKTNENHRLLASLNGEWSFSGHHIYSDTSKKSVEIKGTITQKGIWEDRYFIRELSSDQKLKMPWADGREVTYHDMHISGYDNVKKKFFFVTVSNHWLTGLITSEGTYDSITKTFTYESETERTPGIRTKIHILEKIIDHNHFTTVWHRSDNGKDVSITETNYTRIKKSSK